MGERRKKDGFTLPTSAAKANVWFFDLEIAFTEPCRYFVEHFGIRKSK